jgi:hypothetical protein
MRGYIWNLGRNAITFEGEGGGGTNTQVSAPWTPPAGAQPGVWTLGEGDKAAPWWSAIPDEPARKHLEAKKYANPAELALAHLNLHKLQAGDPNIINLPGKDAKPEDWDALYTKMGRPAKPEDYKFEFGDTKPDEGMVQFGQKLFHKIGLDPARAQTAVSEWNKYVAEESARIAAADTAKNNEEMTKLQSTWGADLEKNKAAGQRVMAALGIQPDFLNRIEGAIGAAPIVELLAMIGRKSDEGSLITSHGQYDKNNPATMSKEQATARRQELEADAEFQKKYLDKNHPEHAAALKLMEGLFSRS